MITSFKDLPAEVQEQASTFSGWITLALEDLEKCDQDPRYMINMSVYHREVGLSEVCHVCLAGAVMAQNCQADPERAVVPIHFDWKLRCMFLSLDSFRDGAVVAAAHYYYESDHITTPIQLETSLKNNWVPGYVSYAASPELFKKWAFRVRDRLKTLGY